MIEIESRQADRAAKQALRITACDDLALRQMLQIGENRFHNEATLKRLSQVDEPPAPNISRRKIICGFLHETPPIRKPKCCSPRIMRMPSASLEMPFPAERGFDEACVGGIETATISAANGRQPQILVDQAASHAAELNAQGGQVPPKSQEPRRQAVVGRFFIEDTEESQAIQGNQAIREAAPDLVRDESQLS